MSKQPSTYAERTPMPALLSVVGEELRHLAMAVERLHGIVELPGVKESLREAHCFAVVQGIDHVTQNLDGLSQFLAALATMAPGGWALDTNAACDAVTIASLSERLRRPVAPRVAAFEGDECEFF